jgi:hypothetical protein
MHVRYLARPSLSLSFLKPRLMHSRATVVIPFYDGVIFVVRSTVPNSSVGFPKLPNPSTRSPGVNSGWGPDGRSSGGFFARSESGTAPAYDKGGCGALRSLGIRLLWSISFLMADK